MSYLSTVRQERNNEDISVNDTLFLKRFDSFRDVIDQLEDSLLDKSMWHALVSCIDRNYRKVRTKKSKSEF
jgi:hypothetical protein